MKYSLQEGEAYLGNPEKLTKGIQKEGVFLEICGQFQDDLSDILNIKTDWDTTDKYTVTFIDQRERTLNNMRYKKGAKIEELFEIRMIEDEGWSRSVIKALTSEAKGLLVKLSEA